MLSLLGFLFFAAFFYLALIHPLDKQLEDGLLQKKALEQELHNLQIEQIEVENKISRLSDLPQTAELLHKSFLHNAIIIEEINATPSTTQPGAGLYTVVIRVTVQGDRNSLLKAVREVQTGSGNICLFQDMDIRQERTIINFKLLTQDKI